MVRIRQKNPENADCRAFAAFGACRMAWHPHEDAPIRSEFPEHSFSGNKFKNFKAFIPT